MNEKTYLFNPFKIEKATVQSISDTYKILYNQLIESPQTMFQYAQNIEIYSNLNYLIGEMIARKQHEYTTLKTKIEIEKAIRQTEERKNWDKDLYGKPPAIAYFEALATRFCQNDINILADLESSVKRFKNAYNSTEEKINALKKKMEAVKYEEFQ